ncbi:MAG: cardiolipin synthase [Weeksellaceae bacterium]
MNLILIIEILYVLLVTLVVIRIVYDTDNPTKTAAYILLTVFLPVIGMLVYFSVGLNYRKKKLYSKKLLIDNHRSEEIRRFISTYRLQSQKELENQFPDFYELNLLYPHKPLGFATGKNQTEILFNGEEKFPELIKALKAAKHHIHIEYYIYENDKTGNEIAQILIEKAKEGVEVRLIYDDFGSRSIRKTMVPKLRKNGVKAYPFYEIAFINFANRINYRNHRKLIIIDAETCFIGGINISDKYDNRLKNKLYWRDMHFKIKGEAAWRMQGIFMADWNFCSGENLQPGLDYFKKHEETPEDNWVQLVSSGPDSEQPEILYTYIQAINSSVKNIYITTPYFVPTVELLSALQIAIRKGVEVHILVPGISDSSIVNAVSKSHYADLLKAGAKIYLYNKGFVHAKTMVCDGEVSIIGTANLDHRSFELNFEVNAIVYDKSIATKLQQIFLSDIEDATQIDSEKWANRPKTKQFFEKVLRIIGPLM